MSTKRQLLITFITFSISARGSDGSGCNASSGCCEPGTLCDGEWDCCDGYQCVWMNSRQGHCAIDSGGCKPLEAVCQWNSDCCSGTCLWPSPNAGQGQCTYLSTENGSNNVKTGSGAGGSYEYVVSRRLESEKCKRECEGCGVSAACLVACQQGTTKAQAHRMAGVDRRRAEDDTSTSEEDADTQHHCLWDGYRCDGNNDCCSDVCLYKHVYPISTYGHCTTLNNGALQGVQIATGTKDDGAEYTYEVDSRRRADNSGHCIEPVQCYVYNTDCCLGSFCVSYGYYEPGYCTSGNNAQALQAQGYLVAAGTA